MVFVPRRERRSPCLRRVASGAWAARSARRAGGESAPSSVCVRVRVRVRVL